VQVRNEVREVTPQYGAAEVNTILDRKSITEIDSGVSLNILARENETSGDYPQGVRALPPSFHWARYLTIRGCFQVTDETDVARDPEDLEPRRCLSWCI